MMNITITPTFLNTSPKILNFPPEIIDNTTKYRTNTATPTIKSTSLYVSFFLALDANSECSNAAGTLNTNNVTSSTTDNPTNPVPKITLTFDAFFIK